MKCNLQLPTRLIASLMVVSLYACQSPEKQAPKNDSFPVALPPPPVDTLDYDSSVWTDVLDLDSTFVLDIRYATANNFVDTPMYACGRCLLRPKVAKVMVKIQQELRREGLGIKFYDCYRPRPVQWQLWKKVPDPRYVADPRRGSMHNRGVAVDLTLIDSTGQELPMGTPYDYFGPRAYHTYRQLPDSVIANRQKLLQLMQRYNFRPTSTEWWHYSYRGGSYALADMEWACPEQSAAE